MPIASPCGAVTVVNDQPRVTTPMFSLPLPADGLPVGCATFAWCNSEPQKIGTTRLSENTEQHALVFDHVVYSVYYPASTQSTNSRLHRGLDWLIRCVRQAFLRRRSNSETSSNIIQLRRPVRASLEGFARFARKLIRSKARLRRS
jgi:hypothetical protein